MAVFLWTKTKEAPVTGGFRGHVRAAPLGGKSHCPLYGTCLGCGGGPFQFNVLDPLDHRRQVPVVAEYGVYWAAVDLVGPEPRTEELFDSRRKISRYNYRLNRAVVVTVVHSEPELDFGQGVAAAPAWHRKTRRPKAVAEMVPGVLRTNEKQFHSLLLAIGL